MLARRGFLLRSLGSALAGAAALLPGGPVRGAIGYNPLEVAGGSVADGFAGRIVDSATGAGLFNPNIDPSQVGQDATGTSYAVGTDMSFGAPIIRQILSGAINGDFLTAPPSGAWQGSGSAVPYYVDSDPLSGTFNPLPGCLWTASSDGLAVAYLYYSSGKNRLVITSTGAAASGGSAAWPVVAPFSTGQQYRVLISAYIDLVSATNATISYQFYQPDGVTTVGAEISRAITFGGTQEYKLDAGLIPATAGRLRVKINLGSTSGSAQGLVVSEIRCSFVPAEASLGLGSTTGGTAITTAETQAKGITIPANTLVAGSSYRISGYGTVTASVSNVCTFRVKINPTSLGATTITSVNPSSTATAAGDAFSFECLLTVRSAGGTGVVAAGITVVGQAAQPFAVAQRVAHGTATVDTTSAQILELTVQTAAGTTTVTIQQCVIQCLMAS